MPDLPYPSQVFPSNDGVGQSSGDIAKRHRTIVGNEDVLKFGYVAVQEKRREPAGIGKDVRQVGKFCEQRSAQPFPHAVSLIAFAHAGDGRIDSDDQAVKPARWARSMAASAASRPPTRYS